MYLLGLLGMEGPTVPLMPVLLMAMYKVSILYLLEHTVKMVALQAMTKDVQLK